MANFNVRCKGDYEDLDNTWESSVESIRRNSHTITLNPSPFFFKSDSAINCKQNPCKADNFSKQMKYGLDGSIPCFLQQGVAVQRSLNELPQQFPEKNSTQNSKFLSRCSLKRKNIWLLGFVCFYIFYLIIGSFCIEKIEEPIELMLRQEWADMRDKFLLQYPQIAATNELEELVKVIIAAHDLGIVITDDFQNETNWNFGKSFFFSTSLVTTIGYGNTTPRTVLGKIFCIVFSAIGIPLTLVLLSAMVHRLLTPTNYLLKVLIEKLSHSQSAFIIRIIHLIIIGSLGLIIFFLIPIAIFLSLEKEWTILDAFYFCFISLTTVGLGDQIPGETVNSEYDTPYKVIVSIYLILGLIGTMLVLTVFYGIPELNIGLLFMDNNDVKKVQAQSVKCDIQKKHKTRASSVPT